MSKVTNVIIAGLGGQGVLKASDILAEVVFRAGRDVKKSEVHGMSQRGGSVNSGVRFGENVLSPMVPEGQADYLVVLAEDQVENNRHTLSSEGVLLEPGIIDADKLQSKKSLNVAMLGALSIYLDVDKSVWLETIHDNLTEKLHAMNDEAFEMGRQAAKK